MANTTFYNRGDAYHDSAGNPAIIKKGNELTFTEHFNAGGGVSTINMLSNTDYLTNKVLNGKPVYMRYINLDAVVGNRNVLTDVDEILLCDLKIITANSSITLPSYNLQYSTSFTYQLNTTTHTIEYKTSDMGSSYAMTGYIEYTKPTPAETNNTRTVKKSTNKKKG